MFEIHDNNKLLIASFGRVFYNCDISHYTLEDRLKITTLGIYGSEIISNGQVDHLIDTIEQFPKINEIRLVMLNGKNVGTFINRLLNCNFSLKSLSLSYVDCSNVNLSSITKFPLKKLGLVNIEISECKFISVLKEILNDNTTIKILDIANKKINFKDDNYQIIIKLLEENKIIEELTISFHTTLQARMLGKYISNNKTLTTFYLHLSSLGIESGHYISQILKINQSLESFSISIDDIDNERLAQIFDGLSSSKSIKKIYLCVNSLEIENLDLVADYLNKIQIESFEILVNECPLLKKFWKNFEKNKTINNLVLYSRENNYKTVSLTEETEKILERNKYQHNLKKYLEFRNQIMSRIAFPNEICFMILEKLVGLSILEIKKILAENQHLEKYLKDILG